MTPERCPHCGREVASNRPYAVMRCAGCATLLQMENGKIVRSAKPETKAAESLKPEVKPSPRPEPQTEAQPAGSMKIDPPLPVPRAVAPLRAKPLATPAPELLRPPPAAAPEPKPGPPLEPRPEALAALAPKEAPSEGASIETVITEEEEEVVAVDLPAARPARRNGAGHHAVTPEVVAAGSRPPARRSRRMVRIATAAGLSLVVVVSLLAIVLTRRSDEPAPSSASEPPVPAITHVPTPPAEPAAAAPEPQPALVPPAEPATAPPPEAPRKKTLGGKPVVLEYDKPPAAPAPAPQGVDEKTVSRARDAYQRGNKKLFAGDADGAIALYRESLRIYPGYVAAYRGLGLAYAQKGDGAEAIQQMRTYVRAVPGAKDVGLVKQRIDRLQRQNRGR